MSYTEAEYGDRNGLSLLEFMMNTSDVRTLQQIGFKLRTL